MSKAEYRESALRAAELLCEAVSTLALLPLEDREPILNALVPAGDLLSDYVGLTSLAIAERFLRRQEQERKYRTVDEQTATESFAQIVRSTTQQRELVEGLSRWEPEAFDELKAVTLDMIANQNRYAAEMKAIYERKA